MFLFLCTKLFQKREHYSRGDIIQGRILFKEIWYFCLKKRGSLQEFRLGWKSNSLLILNLDLPKFVYGYSTLKYIEVTDYCVTYACHQDSLTWQIRADACLCYQSKALAIVDSEIPKQLKRYRNIF